MPDAITVLERLGVATPAADACLLRCIRFLSPQMRSFPSCSCGLSVGRDHTESHHDRRAAEPGVELP